MSHSGTIHGSGNILVLERVKAVFCVGLVVLGLLLTIPWWGLIGWAALQLLRRL